MAPAATNIPRRYLSSEPFEMNSSGNERTIEVMPLQFQSSDARTIVLVPATAGCALASEKSLRAIWMTPEEEEAWKDL